MMRMTIAFSVLALALTVSVNCKTISAGDLKIELDKVTAIYKGYFEIVEKNQSDLDKALEEGDKHLKANTDTVKAIMGKLTNTVTADEKAVKVLEDFQKEIMQLSMDYGGKLSSSFSANPDAAQKFKSQLDEFAKLLGADSSSSAGLNDSQRTMVKEQIISTAKEFSSTITDPTQRDSMLTEWAKSVGGSQADQDAFKAELKTALGW